MDLSLIIPIVIINVVVITIIFGTNRRKRNSFFPLLFVTVGIIIVSFFILNIFSVGNVNILDSLSQNISNNQVTAPEENSVNEIIKENNTNNEPTTPKEILKQRVEWYYSK